MERVAVVGPGGAGKSILSRQLGALLGVPVIHLDEHFWQPGWVETPQHVWRQVQRELLAGKRWVADGNYGSTLELRLSRVDTVVVLQPPRWVCIAGVLRRTLLQRDRQQAPGCTHRVTVAFLRWVWRYPTDSRPRLDARLAEQPDVAVVELRSRRAADAWLSELARACVADLEPE